MFHSKKYNLIRSKTKKLWELYKLLLFNSSSLRLSLPLSISFWCDYVSLRCSMNILAFYPRNMFSTICVVYCLTHDPPLPPSCIAYTSQLPHHTPSLIKVQMASRNAFICAMVREINVNRNLNRIC